MYLNNKKEINEIFKNNIIILTNITDNATFLFNNKL